MALPNLAMSFSPFAILTAGEQNNLVENIEYLETKKVDNTMLSTVAGDVGGAWLAWSPTIVGFSSAPTGGIYKYTQIGKTVSISVVQGSNGTSNSTGFTISLPVTAASGAVTIATVVNNGADTMGLARITASDYTVLSIQNGLTNGFGAWTATGTKACRFASITYQAA